METPASEHMATLQAKQFPADHETKSKNGAPVAERAAPDVDARPSSPVPSVHSAPEGRRSLLRALGKRVATLAIAFLAIVVALVTWQHYVTAPWTPGWLRACAGCECGASGIGPDQRVAGR